MRFAESQFFLILVFLAPLWFFLMRELKLKKKVLNVFGGNSASLKSKQVGKGILISFLIIFLVAAFARPQIESYQNEIKLKTNTEIALCFDLSRSMGLAKKDANSPSRIDRSKEIALDLLNEVRGARVAVFGQTSICQELVPLTNDLELVRSTIEFMIYTESIGGSGSYFGQGLKEIAGKFEENDRQKFIIFFTDGEFSEKSDDFSLLEESIVELKKNNIKLILVGVGEIPGIKIPVLDDAGQIVDYHISALNEGTLRAIAQKANGVYINEKEKKEIFGCLKKASVETETNKDSLIKKKVYQDIYWIFLLPVLVCWWLIIKKRYH